MLNRTNRMLSANLNRLNLGTRSLAQMANLNMDPEALRTRHTHPVVPVRVGIIPDIRYPKSKGSARTGVPGSPSATGSSFGSSPLRPWFGFVVEDLPTWQLPAQGQACRDGRERRLPLSERSSARACHAAASALTAAREG
jgi:hypothetical protein